MFRPQALSRGERDIRVGPAHKHALRSMARRYVASTQDVVARRYVTLTNCRVQFGYCAKSRRQVRWSQGPSAID